MTIDLTPTPVLQELIRDLDNRICKYTRELAMLEGKVSPRYLVYATEQKIDLLEGVPYLYRRVLTNYELNGTMEIAGLYYYLSIMEDIPNKKMKTGYWGVDKKKKFSVYVDNRLYQDTADKIVFHMRFFDGDRAPTNSKYMVLVKKRSHLQLNTENEEIFLMDCIHYGNISENSLTL